MTLNDEDADSKVVYDDALKFGVGAGGELTIASSDSWKLGNRLELFEYSLEPTQDCFMFLLILRSSPEEKFNHGIREAPHFFSEMDGKWYKMTRNFSKMTASDMNFW